MTPPKKNSKEQSSVMVFVDVDNTLVKGATIYMFGIEAWRSGFIRWHHVIPALFQQRYFIRKGETTKRLKSTRERAQSLVAGHQVADFEGVAEAAWRRSIAPKLFPEMMERLAWHKKQGHAVWLLTASPQGLAHVMARDLKLAGALGTQLEVVDGVFTGEIDGELLHGPLKAQAAHDHAQKHGVRLSDCFGYSDSAADIPLLDSVGHPVAVNPDHSLVAYATKKGWPVIWPASTNRHHNNRVKRAEKSAGHSS